MKSLYRSTALTQSGKYLATYGSWVAICILAGGCSQSKEERAQERMMSHKAPAYVRLVNYGKADASLSIKGKLLAKDIKPGSASVFIISGSGKQKVVATSEGKDVFTSEITLDPGSAASILVGPQSTKLIDKEVREGQAGQSSIRVVVVSSGASVSIKADGTSFEDNIAAESGSDNKTISPGSHKFTVQGSDGKMVQVDGELIAGDAYTIFVDLKAGGATANLVKNSPNRKPATGGLSKV